MKVSNDQEMVAECDVLSPQTSASPKELAQKLQLQEEKFLALKTESILVLPNNRAISDPSKKTLFFHEDAKELLFILREAGLSAQFYSDGRPKESIDFRSASVILPAVLFVGKKVLEGGLAAIGAWIVKKWLMDPKSNPPTVKAEYILFENGVIQRWVSIEGPAKKVADILRGHDGRDDGDNPPRKRIGK